MKKKLSNIKWSMKNENVVPDRWYYRWYYRWNAFYQFMHVVLFKICRCCSNVTDHCTHFSFKITFLQRKSNPRNIQAPNFRVRWILKLTSKEDKRNQMKFYPIFLFNFLNVAIVQFDLIFGWINFHTFNFQTFYHFFEYLLIIKLTLFPPSQICTE